MQTLLIFLIKMSNNVKTENLSIGMIHKVIQNIDVESKNPIVYIYITNTCPSIKSSMWKLAENCVTTYLKRCTSGRPHCG